MTTIARLHNWTVCGEVLFGEVYNHPKFPDGVFIRTSYIKKIYWVNGPRVKTRNTIYKLRGRNLDPKMPSYLTLPSKRKGNY